MNSYVAPKPITHEVNGKEYDFHPLAMRLLFKVRNLAKPLAESMAVIFEDHKGDRAAGVMSAPEGTQTSHEAVDPLLAAQRTRERKDAMGRLVEVFCDEKNGEILAEIILDSIRDREDPPVKKKEREEFIETVDVPTFVQFLMGVGKANMEVFGPVGERMALAAKGVLEKVGNDANEDDSETPA